MTKSRSGPRSPWRRRTRIFVRSRCAGGTRRRGKGPRQPQTATPIANCHVNRQSPTATSTANRHANCHANCQPSIALWCNQKRSLSPCGQAVIGHPQSRDHVRTRSPRRPVSGCRTTAVGWSPTATVGRSHAGYAAIGIFGVCVSPVRHTLTPPTAHESLSHRIPVACPFANRAVALCRVPWPYGALWSPKRRPGSEWNALLGAGVGVPFSWEVPVERHSTWATRRLRR